MVYVLAYIPYVVCNEINTIYNGFNFNGPNDHAVWAGNIMQPLGRGLLLLNGGKIGQQGGPSIANANKWNGTWTYTHTFVSNTTATNSLLWVKNNSGYIPVLNSGTLSIQNYGAPGTLSVSGGGDYNCGGVPNNISVPLPDSDSYPTAELYYIAKTATNRFLALNDSVLGSHSDYSDFADVQSVSSVGKFVQLENLIHDGNIGIATTSLSGIDGSGFNTVENNYKLFYSLYLNFLSLDQEENFSITDSSALYSLTQLCPATDSACVTQARALYSVIYCVNVDYQDCEVGSSAKIAHNNNAQDILVAKSSEIELFPNPAQNEITIVSKEQMEEIEISIRDVAGRVLLFNKLKTNEFSCHINLHLVNGIYFVSIRNSKNEKVNKKLVISK